jgi:hypothetical protein
MDDPSYPPAINNPFRPDDPRHRIVCALIGAQEHSALAELMETFVTKGNPDVADVAKYARRVFDAGAQAIAMSVSGLLSAQSRSSDIDELAERVLSSLCENMIPHLAKGRAISIQDLQAESRIAIAARIPYWKAAAYQYGLESELDNAGSEISSDTDATSTPVQRQVNEFIARVGKAGRKISRADIVLVAGYKDKTEFVRFQSGSSRATPTAKSNFNRVLRMSAVDFLAQLDLRKRK